MKIYRFYLVLLCFVVSQNSFAQDPILFEGIWELESITLNGETYFPPSNDEVEEVGLYFMEANNGNPDTIAGSVCDSFIASVTFQETDGGLPTFMIGDDYVTTFGMCDLSENANFESVYFTFYLYADAAMDPFEYFTTFSGDDGATLDIMSSAGDVAIYNRAALSTSDFTKPSFTIYPNPSSDQLYIEAQQETGDYTITVFDVQGKQQLTTSKEVLGSNPLDIQNWASGVYFVRFESQNGVITTQRFIKK